MAADNADGIKILDDQVNFNGPQPLYNVHLQHSFNPYSTLVNMAKDPTARIQTLEKHLSRGGDSFNPNPLLELIHLARHDDPRIVHSAIWALHRVFIKIIGDGRVGRATLASSMVQEVESEELDVGGEGWQVREWIMKRLGEYVDVLAGLMRDSEEALRVSAQLSTLCSGLILIHSVIIRTAAILATAIIISSRFTTSRSFGHSYSLRPTPHPPHLVPGTFASRSERGQGNVEAERGQSDRAGRGSVA